MHISGVPLLLQLLSIGIVGPIIEECIFRAFIIKGIFVEFHCWGSFQSLPLPQFMDHLML